MNRKNLFVIGAAILVALMSSVGMAQDQEVTREQFRAGERYDMHREDPFYFQLDPPNYSYYQYRYDPYWRFDRWQDRYDPRWRYDYWEYRLDPYWRYDSRWRYDQDWRYGTPQWHRYDRFYRYDPLDGGVLRNDPYVNPYYRQPYRLDGDVLRDDLRRY